MEELLRKIEDYMQAQGHVLFTNPGQLNIVYVEGMNTDGTLNADRPDEFNDLGLVFDYLPGRIAPRLLLAHPCTTEPGVSATLSAAAAKRGGVARIAFGQYKAWKVGRHKGQVALVQSNDSIVVVRDANRNFIRDRTDPRTKVTGCNQHGPGKGRRPKRVGNYSEGCLVRPTDPLQEEFMRVVMSDPQYLADPDFVYTTTILPGDKL